MARGRYQGRAFGETLGKSPTEAQPKLFQLMAGLDNGSFVPSSERRSRKLRRSVRPKLTPRELFDDYLADCRKRCGWQTAETYKTRLMPVLDFLEQAGNRKQWRLTEDIERDCVLKLRAYLTTRTVTRNGRAGAPSKPMSPRQVKHCLETLRATINWALRAEVRKLPVDFRNPITQDIVGQLPQKDPLRKAAVSLDNRVQIVHHMDAWELTHLTGRLILPLRHEELCSILISDVGWTAKSLYVGTRFDGCDFTKGRTSFTIPLDPLLLQLWFVCAKGRADGLLFRSPHSWQMPLDKDPATFPCRREIEECIAVAFLSKKEQEVQTDNDRKQVIRDLFYKCGGMHPDDVRRAMKRLYKCVGLPEEIRAYDLKGSSSQSMRDSGMPHLESRYLTGHAVNDIINEYVGLNPEPHMAKYYESVMPLLNAIRDRAKSLGLSLDDYDRNYADVSGTNSVRPTAG